MNSFIADVSVIGELKKIASDSNGVIAPETVVLVARDPNSVLHRFFEWDDTAAAEKWRIEQARRLLQITVEYIQVGSREPIRVRAFHSLKSDRENGGYRLTVDVLQDQDMRNQMLQDAIDDLMSFRKKYKELKELTKVFEAIDAVVGGGEQIVK